MIHFCIYKFGIYFYVKNLQILKGFLYEKVFNMVPDIGC